MGWTESTPSRLPLETSSDSFVRSFAIDVPPAKHATWRSTAEALPRGQLELDALLLGMHEYLLAIGAVLPQ